MTSFVAELQNFIVLVRVTKLGESEIVWQSDLLNRTSEQYRSLAKASQAQLEQMQMSEGLKDNYIGSDVMSIEQAVDGNGVLVNMTIHLTESGNLDEHLLKEKLVRTLEKSELLPSPQLIYADLEDVTDFDECSSEKYNDCASSARCINQPGSYRCECLNGYPDLDISLPGRMCASEIKACEFCHGHGDCFRDETGQISSCKCYRMYLGRRCDINGLRKCSSKCVAKCLLTALLSASHLHSGVGHPVHHFYLLNCLLLSKMEESSINKRFPQLFRLRTKHDWQHTGS